MLGCESENPCANPVVGDGGSHDGERAAGGKRIPEDWLGHAVQLVFISGSSTEYIDGVLEEVNDRGIVLSVDLHVGYPRQSLFYPWSAVVQLSEDPGKRPGT
jgi:hypothetical protein